MIGAGSPTAPRLRGLMHAYAVVPALALGVALVVLAPASRSRVSAVLYGSGLLACLGVSALYHRGGWSARVKAILARIDHSTIFLLIAGTASPIFLVSVGGGLGTALVIIEWAGAAVGIAMAVLWRQPPVWAEVAPYILLGWLGVAALPALVVTVGWAGPALLIGGGLLYTVGAACYAAERPNPWPSTFGFHEIFHSFVVAAAAAHAVLIGIVVIAT